MLLPTGETILAMYCTVAPCSPNWHHAVVNMPLAGRLTHKVPLLVLYFLFRRLSTRPPAHIGALQWNQSPARQRSFQPREMCTNQDVGVMDAFAGICGRSRQPGPLVLWSSVDELWICNIPLTAAHRTANMHTPSGHRTCCDLLTLGSVRGRILSRLNLLLVLPHTRHHPTLPLVGHPPR